MKMETLADRAVPTAACGRCWSSPNVHVAAQAPLRPARAARRRVGGRHDARPGRVRGRGARRRRRRRAGALPSRTCSRLEWLLLGYDVDGRRGRGGSSPTCTASAPTLSCDPALIPGEHRLLALFADLAALTRPRHDEDEPESELLRSPREHLHAWLRSLDAEAEGLPAGVHRRSSARALAHYGVDEPRPHARARGGLLPAVPLPASARRRRAAAVLAILDRRLRARRRAGRPRGRRLPRGARPAGRRDGGPRRDPRRPRPRGPLPLLRRAVIEAARERASTPRWSATSTRWPPIPGARTATSGSRALVACPRPLAPLLTARMSARGAGRCAARCSRRSRAASTACARSRASTEETLDGQRVPRPAGYRHEGPAPASRHGLRRARRPAGRGPRVRAAGRPTLPDGRARGGRLLRRAPGDALTRDELAERLRAALADVPLPPTVHRIVVAVAEPGRGRGMSAIDAVHVPSRARRARRGRASCAGCTR